jgi:predicted phage tail protein
MPAAMNTKTPTPLPNKQALKRCAMLRDVHLHGRLKKKFGPVFRFDVDTAAEALRALNCAFPGKFVAELREGAYKINRGRKTGGMSLDLELVTKFNLGSADLHIIPVAEGSSQKGRGTTKAIIGVALVGAAIFFSGGTLATPLGLGLGTLGMSYGTIAAAGVGLALMGVGMMKAPSEAPTTPERADPANSWTLAGPGNTIEQGNAVPLVYGEGIFGSVTVSAGLDIENAGAYQS